MSLSANPCAAGSDPFLGEIDTFAFTFCPVNWAPLNGQLLKISSNIALFSLLGTTYGGDGTTTFALPTGKPVFHIDPGCAGDPMHRLARHFPEPKLTGRGGSIGFLPLSPCRDRERAKPESG